MYSYINILARKNINLHIATLNYKLYFPQSQQHCSMCVSAKATVTFFFRRSPTPELNLDTDSYPQLQLDTAELNGLQPNLLILYFTSNPLTRSLNASVRAAEVFVTGVGDDV